MQKLLPYFERELAFLHTQAGEFARRYPKVAGRLQLRGDVGEDPHVQRLVESFALLSSRIHKRLDDDFPQFTEKFLEVLYPHYLRPFPSCSIAQFDLGPSAAQMSKASRIDRGAYLNSHPVMGVACKFRTVYPVEMLPVRIRSVRFDKALLAPTGSNVPKGATSVLSIELELTSPQANWRDFRRVRLYIDGDSSQVTALREAFFQRVVGVLVQTTVHQPWVALDKALPQLVGFDEDEALLDFEARSQPAYRLLTEYFNYPEKFNFVDLPMADTVNASEGRTITLHYVMSGIRGESDEAHLLETISAKNLKLGCTPVVNLFERKADPIRINHAHASYPVLPDGRRAYGYEVYSIEKVYRVQQTPQGETIVEFRPFFSLQHEVLLSEGEASGQYWTVRRDDTLSEQSPGYETEVSIVDLDFNPAVPQTDTLSIDVKATNRDLPERLSIGNVGGDLFLEGGSFAHEVRFLRKPSSPQRFDRGRGTLWRLISHLSLNHLSLTASGIDALKELLHLYDLPRSAANRRLLDGLLSIEYLPTSAWLPGLHFPTLVRGTEIRIAVDEQGFVGSGLRLFSTVLDRFFALYVSANSFTQLTIVSGRTQEVLLAFPPANGDMALV